ncbi:MAG: hypothetical protein CML20_00120 [Rheinheimera sp.]|uniref:hypothetical protein n=1 Tax=Arsukibacterium sp. UBA3155 TaxID=1946058 RepID=UPI000C8BBDA5|nr:hypothetical protein [Arsukibacterium sp. UBA3155]MAD73210.1 hypothetical protein [Rheinheimera sp.]
MQDNQIVIGIAWFQPDSWKRLKRIADDRADLDDSYDEWKKNANAALTDIRATGKIVKRVNVDIDELLSWCKAESKPVNSASRAQFVSGKLRVKPNKP